MSCKPLVVATLAVLLPFAGLAHAQDSGPYKVLKIQLTGGDGGFDYVTADSDGRNLYVARSGPAGHIGVYNLDTLVQVGDIPGVSAHGGAVDTSTGHGFATSKPVTMFDSKTFAILKKIDVQGNPDGYLNDAYNHHFYVLSHSAPNWERSGGPRLAQEIARAVTSNRQEVCHSDRRQPGGICCFQAAESRFPGNGIPSK